jgi:DNA-binding response OmpR family regulator
MPKKILLMESTYFITRLIGENLRQFKEIVLTEAFTGKDGLRLLENDKFDLLIMNMNLYDMSGFEVLSGLDRSDIDQPLMVMTNDPDKLKTSEDPRMNGIIRLPIDFDSFNEKVKDFLKI